MMPTIFAQYIADRIQPKSVFEYGCQSLDDIEFYKGEGIEATGFNPFIEGIRLKPDFIEAEVVTIIYGLNRMPHRSVRVAAIHESYSYLQPGGLLVVATKTKDQVIRAVHDAEWVPYEDGFVATPDSIMFQTGIDYSDLVDMFKEANVPICFDCLRYPILDNGSPIKDAVVLSTK